MKKAIVTGASKGIGKAISKELLKNGYIVIGIARTFNKNPIDHPNFLPHSHDLSDLPSLPSFFSSLLKQHPQIDVLISNVGKGLFNHIEQFSYQDIEELTNLNFLSHVFLIKTFLPQLKKQNRGDIIFIGSEAALKGQKMGSIYCATKFALRGFFQSIKHECKNTHLRISMINPGMVKSDFYSNLPFSHGPNETEYILPEDVSKTVSLILQTRQGTTFDEITLSPKKKVISTGERAKPSPQTPLPPEVFTSGHPN